MKRILLTILSVMTFAGMSVAQDIYVAGYHTDESGTKQPVVHKNGLKIYESSLSNGYYGEVSAVELCDGDVYWAENVFSSNGIPNYGDVVKNGSVYLNSPSGEGRHINRLCHDPKTNIIYAAGYMDIGGVRTGVVWKGSNANPHYTMGNGANSSEATGLCLDNENATVYTAGIQFDGPSVFHGAIWKNGSELYNLGTSVIINDIAFYNGFVYTVGVVSVGSNLITKVWRDNVVQYTLTQTYSSGNKIYIDAGDIYVSGYEGYYLKVWKNGEPLYEHPTGSSGASLNCVMANNMGVYYSGRLSSDSPCMIWNDGDKIGELSDCDYVKAICVEEPVCEDGNIRYLPYKEDFENGSTDWACWTTVDVDSDNPHGKVSYWDRIGTRMATGLSGNYGARHYYNVNDQEGWLISPKIILEPNYDNIKLSFMTQESPAADYTYEGVWVAINNNALSNFHEVWTQESPSEEWKTVTIDLKDYQGEAIYVAFKYSGEYGHNWYIDNISITGGTGVEEGEATALTVCPNPARESIRIPGLEANSQVEIYNSLGELVRVMNANPDQEIGIRDLASGLYLIRCGHATLRFVKE